MDDDHAKEDERKEILRTAFDRTVVRWLLVKKCQESDDPHRAFNSLVTKWRDSIRLQATDIPEEDAGQFQDDMNDVEAELREISKLLK